jgi:hypothetical protein
VEEVLRQRNQLVTAKRKLPEFPKPLKKLRGKGGQPIVTHSEVLQTGELLKEVFLQRGQLIG